MSELDELRAKVYKYERMLYESRMERDAWSFKVDSLKQECDKLREELNTYKNFLSPAVRGRRHT